MDWIAKFPVFVRGEAYLAERQGSEAAAEFQMILNHRGLGRAYVLQGDIPQVEEASQESLTLWKDADPDIPVLQKAKADCSKLH